MHSYNAPAAVSVVIFIVFLFLNSLFLVEEYPGVEKLASSEKQG